MPYIDPHIHTVSRITDDYVRMARAGCVAVLQPRVPGGVQCVPGWIGTGRV